MDRSTITTQIPELASFYFLTNDGTLVVYDTEGTAYVDHESSAALRDHAKALLAEHLADPEHSAIRLAVVTPNRGRERWDSPTLIFDEVMVRALYPVAGVKRARLTDFQKRNKEKSIYQGIEILLDYRIEAAPDTPFYLPVLFDRGRALADYPEFIDREQESAGDTVPTVEVLNLIAKLPLNKKCAPEIVELHQKIRTRCIDKSLRAPIDFEMVENALPQDEPELQGEVEYYDAERRRMEQDAELSEGVPTGRQPILPETGRKTLAVAHDATPVPKPKAEERPRLYTGKVTPELLRFFVMFRDLDLEALKKLAASTHAKKAAAGDCLIERGTADDWNYFLVEGVVELEAADGVKRIVEGGKDNARSALSYLLPRKYEAIALTPIVYLQIHDGLISSVAEGTGVDPGTVALSPTLSLKDNPIMQALCADLAKESLRLPILPDSIERLRALLAVPGATPQQIVEAIEADPVMTVRLLRAAPPADDDRKLSVAAALDRLGLSQLGGLVDDWKDNNGFVVDSPYVQRRMHEIWDLSHKVAEISSLLARISPPLEPDIAFLAGLLHEVGAIAILSYATRYPELADDAAQIERFIGKLHGEIGGKALRQWGLPPEIALAAQESDEWFRDSGENPDYCDLVLVAKLHSFVGAARTRALPPMDQLPAFQKLAAGRLTPAASLEIVQLARSGRADARRLPTP